MKPELINDNVRAPCPDCGGSMNFTEKKGLVRKRNIQDNKDNLHLRLLNGEFYYTTGELLEQKLYKSKNMCSFLLLGRRFRRSFLAQRNL